MAIATSSLAVTLLHPGAQPPERSRPGDAGYDLRCVEPFTLAPGERATVPTGVAIAVPEGAAGLVVPRSGLAARHGISVVNGPGLIDPNYRGEVKVVLVNLGQSPTRGSRATGSPSSCWCRAWRPRCWWSRSCRGPSAAPPASAPPAASRARRR